MVREETIMGENRIRVIVLFLTLGLVPLTVHAADDLFDSKAAMEHIEKGIANLKAQNFDAAIEEFDESASIAPEAESYYYLGYAYYLKSRKGDEESRRLSLENFQKAYEIDPNFTPTRYNPKEPSPNQGRQPQKVETPAPAMTQQPSAPAAEPNMRQPEDTSVPQTLPAEHTK
jgi:tetratricopeptide (TPR) repeat protein